MEVDQKSHAWEPSWNHLCSWWRECPRIWTHWLPGSGLMECYYFCVLKCSGLYFYFYKLLHTFTTHHLRQVDQTSSPWGLLLSRNSTKITFCCHSIHGSARQPSLVERAKKCMICRPSPEWMPLRLGRTASPRASRRVLRRTRTGWTLVVFFAPFCTILLMVIILRPSIWRTMVNYLFLMIYIILYHIFIISYLSQVVHDFFH